MIGFLLGVFSTIMILVMAVFYRRRGIRALMAKMGRGGENSRERVGETVVAVLNSGTRKRKRIRQNWIIRFKQKIRGAAC